MASPRIVGDVGRCYSTPLSLSGQLAQQRWRERVTLHGRPTTLRPTVQTHGQPFSGAKGAPGRQGGQWRQGRWRQHQRHLRDVLRPRGFCSPFGGLAASAALTMTTRQVATLRARSGPALRTPPSGVGHRSFEGRDQPLRLNLPVGAEDACACASAGQGQRGPGDRPGDLYRLCACGPRLSSAPKARTSSARPSWNLAQALLGGTVTVPTLEGSVRMKVPADRPGHPATPAWQGYQGRRPPGRAPLKPPTDLDEAEEAQIRRHGAKRAGTLKPAFTSSGTRNILRHPCEP